MILRVIAGFLRLFRKTDKYKTGLIFASGSMLNPVDNRDYVIDVVGDVVDVLPDNFSLKHFVREVKNQLSGNACVAFSMASCYEIMANVQSHPHHDLELSEMFAWYEARKMRGWSTENSGTFPRDMCKVFQKGFTLEQVCPYLWNDWYKKPEIVSYWIRGLFKIKEYYTVRNIHSAKTILASGIPISITFPTKVVTQNSFSKGYHQITIIGYDDDAECFEYLNSWGKYWDDNGYGTISYDDCEKYIRNSTVIIPWFWK